MKEENAPESLFNPGKAEWLREKGHDNLSEEQQALLLAMAQLEASLGRNASAEELRALEAMASDMEGFDPLDIAQAVEKMIQTPADPKRKTSWPKLRRSKK